MKLKRKLNESSFNKNIYIEISTKALPSKNDETFQTGLVKTGFDRIYNNVWIFSFLVEMGY